MMLLDNISINRKARELGFVRDTFEKVSSEQIYPQRKRQKLPSPSFLSFLLFSVVLFKFLF